MKRLLISVLCAAAVMLAASQDVCAQSRKEQRQARREQKLRERAVTDSMMKVLFGDPSVNVGYGTIKKKNLTTAVSSVEVDDRSMSSYGDIGEYLSGRVPGLVVFKSGGSYRFQIRGATTISDASTEPLVLVDGVETTDISSLNPHDIKSVEVLKDTAASAIYGSRASCGVVLITTKSR